MSPSLVLAAQHPTFPDWLTYAIGSMIIIFGALGVVWSRNPVRAALSLVATLFGVAILFIEEDANFLAAVQIIVYAGAVVVLFLFVIMFLGVDRHEAIEFEPLKGQRWLAALLVTVAVGGVVALIGSAHWVATGAHTTTAPINGPHGEVGQLGKELFTRYLWAFEVTAGLLIIAVVGAVVLARRPSLPVDGDAADVDHAGGAPPPADPADPGDRPGVGGDTEEAAQGAGPVDAGPAAPQPVEAGQ